jgi:hypothetical protein
MKLARLSIAIPAFAAAAVSAQTLTLSPSAPTPLDTVVATYVAPIAHCGVLASHGVRMAQAVTGDGMVPDPQAIDIYLASADSCAAPTTDPLHITLGRFPESSYQVQVFEALPMTGGEGQVLVERAFSELVVEDLPDLPRDNYTGEWLTDFKGEGVAVTQFGSHLFFAWTTYDDKGEATWYVVPDAAYQPGNPEGSRFAGTLYVAWGAPMVGFNFSPFQGIVPVGTAYFIEGGTDAAQMRLDFVAAATPPVRTLTRLRF